MYTSARRTYVTWRESSFSRSLGERALPDGRTQVFARQTPASGISRCEMILTYVKRDLCKICHNITLTWFGKQPCVAAVGRLHAQRPIHLELENLILTLKTCKTSRSSKGWLFCGRRLSFENSCEGNSYGEVRNTAAPLGLWVLPWTHPPADGRHSTTSWAAVDTHSASGLGWLRLN